MSRRSWIPPQLAQVFDVTDVWPQVRCTPQYMPPRRCGGIGRRVGALRGAGGDGHALLEGVFGAGGVVACRRRLAEQATQVDEVLLAGGPFGELDLEPLRDELLGVHPSGRRGLRHGDIVPRGHARRQSGDGGFARPDGRGSRGGERCSRAGEPRQPSRVCPQASVLRLVALAQTAGAVRRRNTVKEPGNDDHREAGGRSRGGVRLAPPGANGFTATAAAPGDEPANSLASRLVSRW